MRNDKIQQILFRYPECKAQSNEISCNLHSVYLHDATSDK